MACEQMTKINNMSLPALYFSIFYHLPYSCFPFLNSFFFLALACKKVGNLDDKQENADGCYIALSVPKDVSMPPAILC